MALVHLTAGPHSFASTQVQLPPYTAMELIEFGLQIPDEDLAVEGRETDPHVTVKYGLHDDDPSVLVGLLKGSGPIAMVLGPIQYFVTPEYDVLYIDVKSPDLERVNARISATVPVTDTHAEYQPHATIAYLRPGCGRRYAGDTRFAGQHLTAFDIVFSPSEGERSIIDLVPKISPKAAASMLLLTKLRMAGGPGSGIRGHRTEHADPDKVLNAPSVLKNLKIPSTLYHITSKEQAQQILKDGLRSGQTRASVEGTSRGVYLTDFEPMNHRSFGFIDIPGDTVLAVKTDGLNLRLDPEFYAPTSVHEAAEIVQNINAGHEELSVYSRQTIPASHISLAGDRGTFSHPRVRGLGGPGSGVKGHTTDHSRDKVARARASHKPSTLEKQQWAEKNEGVVSKMTGGKGTDDNRPVDVTVKIGRTMHGIEVKTMLDNGNNKITMHPDSRQRKESWARSNGATLHTVVLDDRGRFGSSGYSGHRVYYRRGVGAFRLEGMTPVKNANHLQKLMRA